VWLVILSDQLPVIALVGRYPANKLIGREFIRRRQLAPPLAVNRCLLRPHMVLIHVSMGYPPLPGMYQRVTHPFATKLLSYCYSNSSVRLACLIHAGGVDKTCKSNGV